MRLGRLGMKGGLFDEGPDAITYPLRGLRTAEGGWEYGALTLEEINALNTDLLRRSLDLFMSFRTFRILPHGKGTLDERRTVLDILMVLKTEEDAFDAWEREKAMRKRK